MKNKFCAWLFEKEIRRVDMYLSAVFCDLSRTYMQRLLEKKCVLINWKVASKNDKVRKFDEISITFETEKMHLEWENIPLHIVYENQDFAIINKAPWINVHTVPWAWWNSWTLVNALIYHMKWLSVIWWIERPWIVHRLDKDTSWLLIIAKSDRSMHDIQVLMNKRKVQKTYIALLNWILKDNRWFIESYIGRDQNDRKKMTAINPINPKLAQTKFKIIDYIDNKYTLVEVDLLTWRTHQIRVHFASIWFPIVGDKTYWNSKANEEVFEKYNLKRQFLHAYKLSFELWGKKYNFVWDLKDDLKKIIWNNELFLEKLSSPDSLIEINLSK